MTHPQTGEFFGRYQIRGILGVGGFATVYRAWDPVLHREVALKALLPHLAVDPDVRKRFLDEAKSLARLEHRSIVNVHDLDEANGLPFFTMDLVTGQTLAEVLANGGLPLPRAIAILQDLGSAIDHLHASGLVHRDIKAANIMLDRGGRVLLMDFGIARILDSTHYTRTASVLGSPETVSPELVRGESVGPFADIYALGVIAYQTLAGRAPFSGDTWRVLYAHVHEPPPSLRTVVPGLPEPVYAAIESALAKQPSERPPSASSFVQMLSAAPQQPQQWVPAPEIAPATQVQPVAAVTNQPTPATLQIPMGPPPAQAPAPAPMPVTSVREEKARAAFLRPQYLAIGALGIVALALVVFLSGALRGATDTGSPSTAKSVATVLPMLPVDSGQTQEQRVTASVPMPVVTDLKIYNNADERREAEFEGGDSFLTCFTLKPGGESQLAVAVTGSEKRPDGVFASDVKARSQAFNQVSGPMCQQVDAVAGSLAPGEYHAWVLQDTTDLARERFRIIGAQSQEEVTSTPESSSDTTITAATSPPGNSGQTTPARTATPTPPRVVATQRPSNVIPNPTLIPAATQPPVTQPVATQPPATQPPATQPPATQPPATQPPATQPPATQPPATRTPAPATATPVIVTYPTAAPATAIVAPPQPTTAPVVVATQPPQGACTATLDGRLRCLQDP